MIEQAIHARWAATAGLIALIPANQFTTGSRLDENTTLPAAVLSLENTDRRRTNSGHTKIRGVRLKLWVQEHYDGVQIRKQLEAAFDNTSWSVTSGAPPVVVFRVLSSRIENDFVLQEDDGVFQFVTDLELVTTR